MSHHKPYRMTDVDRQDTRAEEFHTLIGKEELKGAYEKDVLDTDTSIPVSATPQPHSNLSHVEQISADCLIPLRRLFTCGEREGMSMVFGSHGGFVTVLNTFSRYWMWLLRRAKVRLGVSHDERHKI